jgi:hypothetical protein
MTPPSTALALPDPDDRNAIAIPPKLAKEGVAVVVQNGVRAVVIPETLYATHNIVRPVNEIAQSDPDWSPSFVEVHIDPTLDPPRGNARKSTSGRHVYVEGDALALRKEAILLLADAAGVTVQAWRTPKAELEEDEIGYDAIAYVRRSDGTLASWTGSKAVNVAMEREMVKARCVKEGVFQPDWFRKEWYRENGNLRRKCETKAMLAATALALQLKRGGYTEQELRKPFLIIRWSMTPQDPAVRAQRLLNAEQGLSGRPPRALASAPEPEAEEPLANEPTSEPEEEHVDEHEVEVEHHGDDDAPLPGEPGAEPETAPVAGEISDEVAAAGETVLTFSKKRGQKISELDEAYLKWLATEYEPRPQDVGTHGPVVAQAVVYYRWIEQQAAAS